MNVVKPERWAATVEQVRARCGAGLGPGLRAAIGAQLAELEAGSGALAAYYDGVLGALDGLPLDPGLKECVTIALLAERRATQNLAVHLLIAKLVGVPEATIDGVLALVGVYGGAGSLTDALETRRALERILAEEVDVDALPPAPVDLLSALLALLRRRLTA
jgi:alkylhydroperoxidase/carboxymuconolactone decarboxylase family protein YurZ